MGSILMYVFIFVVSTIFILAILSNGIHSDATEESVIKKTVIIEGLEEKETGKLMPSLDEAFCEPSENSSLVDIDNKCKTLSDKNCSIATCCVFLNGEKCVGGTSSGPTFLSIKGENVDVKYYRHKTKVYK